MFKSSFCKLIIITAFSFCGSVFAAPANDNFNNAGIISGTSGSQVGDNAGATFQVTVDWQGFVTIIEPHPSYNNDQDISRNSVWYQWTSPYTGTAAFWIISDPKQMALSVYTGSQTNSLTEVSRGDVLEREPNTNTPGTPYRGQVKFNAVAGVTYRIAAHGFELNQSATAPGVFTLSWSPLPVPGNDNFESAVIIGGVVGSQIADNANATFQGSNEPKPISVFPVSGSIWYEWTSPYTGVASFSSVSIAHQYLNVYTGTNIGALTMVAQGASTLRQTDNAGNSIGDYKETVRFDAVTGVKYKIAVNVDQFSPKWLSTPITFSWKQGTPVDISLSTSVPAGAIIGSTVKYIATINTTGNAENVVFKAVIPAGFSISGGYFIGSTFYSYGGSSPCVIDNPTRTITCTLLVLSQAQTLAFNLLTQGSGNYSITSSLTKNGSEQDSNNNVSASQVVAGTEVADLTPNVITAKDIDLSAAPSFNTSVVINSLGPTMFGRNNVLTYDLHGVVPDSMPSNCSAATGPVICQIGSASSFTLRLRPTVPVTTGHIISTVSVSSSTPDPAMGNNIAALINSLNSNCSNSECTPTKIPLDSWWVLLLFAAFLVAYSVWKKRKLA